MIVRAYADASEFHSRVMAFLERDEMVNTAPIGIVERLATDPAGAEALGWGKPLLLAVEENEQVVCVAVKTAARNLVVTPGPAVSIAMLADHLARQRISIPGVAGPADAAKAFATAWRKLSSGAVKPLRFLRLFRCDSVVAPRGVAGHLAPAIADGLDMLARWLEAFDRDCGHDHPGDYRERARVKVEERSAFFWNDPEPASMASFATRTARSARISAVYTPPEARNRGYASAAVAELTRQLLDSGLAHCLLFTDLANPTSNSIYQKIGYVPAADFHEYAFAVK